MRLICVVLAAFLSGAFSFTEFSFAQSNSARPYMPKRTEQANQFRSYLKSRWQRVDAQYLPEHMDPKSHFKEAKENKPAQPLSKSQRRLIGAVLIFSLIAFLVFFASKNRLGGGLFAGKQKDVQLSQNTLSDIAGLAGTNIKLDPAKMTIAQFRRLQNPKEGLRLLLLKSLTVCVHENQIAMKRSLTSRDILRLAPNDWKHKNVLLNIIEIAEPVLFGGRDFDTENYNALLDETAKVFFQKSRGVV